MTISNTSLRTSATGADAVLTIPYTFATLASGDLLVIERVISTGVETELTENASTDGYTATYGPTGGTVTTSDSIPSTNEVHVIQQITRTQTLDLQAGGNFNAENIEAALDKNTRMINENRDRINRLIRFPQSDPAAAVAEMDNSVDRAGKYLAFDSTSGAPTVASATDTSTTTITPFAETYLDDTNAAATLATLTAMGEVFNVKNSAYGAVGDGDGAGGGTDDTSAIQAALDAAMNASTNSIVYFPPGDYTTSAALTIDISCDRFFIYGYGATITSSSTGNVIQWGHISDTAVRIIQSGILGLSLKATGAAGTMLFITGKYTANNTFKDMNIDGGSTPAQQGICIWGTGTGNYHNVFENIYMINHDYHISIGYDWVAAAEVADANAPNAQQFSKMNLDDYTTTGVHIQNSVGHWFEGDFNTGGGTDDVLLDNGGTNKPSNCIFHTRNESGATNSYTIEDGCVNNVIIKAKDASNIVDNNTTPRTTVIGHIPLTDNHGIQTRSLGALDLRAWSSQALPIYDGAGTQIATVNTNSFDIHKRITQADTAAFTADDISPSVAGANIFTTPNANTGTLTLTALDDGSQGQIITIVGNDDGAVGKRTIFDTAKATFDIQAPWIGDTDNTLTLINSDGTNWKEISRNTGPVIHRISTTTGVDMKTAGKTTLFTVWSGAVLYVTHIIVRDTSASLAGAGATEYDFGTGANADTWKQNVDLSSMTTSGSDYYVITAGAEKYTESTVNDAFGIKVITGSTAAATATIDVFGYIV